jgi:hypothetical protein
MKQFWDYMEMAEKNKELEIQNEAILQLLAPNYWKELKEKARDIGKKEDIALFQKFTNGVTTWPELEAKITNIIETQSASVTTKIKNIFWKENRLTKFELNRLKELVPLASYIGIQDFYEKLKSTENFPKNISNENLFRKKIRILIKKQLESN